MIPRLTKQLLPVGCVIALAMACSASGATLTWDGSNGDWDWDARWLPSGTEPTAADSVEIDSGSVAVTQPGELADNIFVGYFGAGTLKIETGGQLSNSGSVFGFLSGSTGTANVSGVGSMWTNSGGMQVGFLGSGTLIVEAGGLVSSSTGGIAFNGGSSGFATVTGSGSMWTSGTGMRVGGNGSGTLNIMAGGLVSGGIGSIGDAFGGTSIATVTGTDSKWTSRGAMYVGKSGVGTLLVEDGGLVSNSTSEIGRNVNSVGSATVTGDGSVWSNTSTMFVGHLGSGTLNIEDGGLVSRVGGDGGHLGYSVGSTGTVTVTGTGSMWTHTGTPGTTNLPFKGQLVVGTRGTGTLNIEAGGLVSNTNGYLGRGDGSTGTAKVTGTGSTWKNTAGLYVGGTANEAGGTSTLKVLDNGLVDVDGTLKIWSPSTVTLDGGMIVAETFDHTDSGVFKFTDGTLIVDKFIGNLTQDGGLLAAGNTHGVTQIFGNYMLNAGSLEVELAGLNRGTEYDTYIITGDVTITGGTLDVSTIDPFLLDFGQQFDILSIVGTRTGTFAGLEEGARVGTFGGIDLFITYEANDNNIISLYTNVPEPGSLMILGSAGFGILRRRG